jgi:hypothetical protein
LAGNRILVKDHTNPANGIYVVTTVGTGATGVWDRAMILMMMQKLRMKTHKDKLPTFFCHPN